jgi:hypothetical protein
MILNREFLIWKEREGCEKEGRERVRERGGRWVSWSAGRHI